MGLGILMAVVLFTVGMEWGMGSAGRMFVRSITGGVTVFGTIAAVAILPLGLGFSDALFGGAVLSMFVFAFSSIVGWKLGN